MLLSGEILNRAPLSVAILPPPSLIELCKAMAAIATLASSQNIDDDDIFLENGLLSYENPNYHMDPQRIERNSHLYEEILSELHQQQSSLKNPNKPHIVSSRKDYARIDIESMGVDLKENFSASEKHLLYDTSPSESKTKSDQKEREDLKNSLDSNNKTNKDINEKDNNSLPIKYISGNLNSDDLYALPNKSATSTGSVNNRNNKDFNNELVDEIAPEDDVVDYDGSGGDINDDSGSNQKTKLTNRTRINENNNRSQQQQQQQQQHQQQQQQQQQQQFQNTNEYDDEEGDEEKGKKEEIEGIEDKDANKDLPPGWEKHEDNDGPYYWHIKSGTIQREPPIWPKCGNKELKTPVTTSSTMNPTFIPHRSPNNNISSFQTQFYGSNGGIVGGGCGVSGGGCGINGTRDIMTGSRISVDSQGLSVTRSNTISSSLDQEEERRRREDLSYKRRSYPLKSDSDRPIRFAVRSLGWVEIAEEDLTPERSSKAVNKCIVDLSLGRNDLLDVVGRWGDGKDLFMDLDEGALKLIDPENLTILNTQPIHTIRVWGVGRDNGRDFAYVARDRLTRIHMCHVFRCDTAARTIANTLRDICKRIMIERSLQMDSNNISINSSPNASNGRNAIRPTDLPTENRKWARHPQSFPTPMEEPKKVLKASYLGSLEVNQPTGMEILNNAIDSVMAKARPEQWENVNVSVAPSMISVYSSGDDAKLLTECRVRYLSFLGIGKNVKNCAFIMHTAQDKFVAHVFHCEPSSGALCKTIEAACKLRYQKCLDAHPETRLSSDSNTPSKGIGATIKNLMSSLSLKKDRTNS